MEDNNPLTQSSVSREEGDWEDPDPMKLESCTKESLEWYLCLRTKGYKFYLEE